jgi:hypothetical protein
MMQQEVLMPEKITQTDDDEMSTVSGGSKLFSEGGIVSLPSSPSKAWPETPTDALGVPPATLADLPSLGSLGHFAGQCSRCCFHPKGRCQNGYDCRFCHFDHEKRRRKKKIPVGYMSMENQHIRQVYEQPAMSQVHQQLGLLPAVGFEPQIHAPVQGAVNRPLEPYTITEPHRAGATAPPVECWSVEKVMDWLASVELSHLSTNFQQHRITGDVLLELSPGDLEEIGIRAVGDRKRFLRGVSQLRGSLQVPQSAPVLPSQAEQALQQGILCQPPCWDANVAPPSLSSPPPPYCDFNNSWPSPPHMGQQSYTMA